MTTPTRTSSGSAVARDEGLATLARFPTVCAPPRDEALVFERPADGIHVSAFAERARGLAPYVGAGISYIAIGVVFTPFMTFWVVAFAWLLLWTWGLPAFVGRMRR